MKANTYTEFNSRRSNKKGHGNHEYTSTPTKANTLEGKNIRNVPSTKYHAIASCDTNIREDDTKAMKDADLLKRIRREEGFSISYKDMLETAKSQLSIERRRVLTLQEELKRDIMRTSELKKRKEVLIKKINDLKQRKEVVEKSRQREVSESNISYIGKLKKVLAEHEQELESESEIKHKLMIVKTREIKELNRNINEAENKLHLLKQGKENCVKKYEDNVKTLIQRVAYQKQLIQNREESLRQYNELNLQHRHTLMQLMKEKEELQDEVLKQSNLVKEGVHESIRLKQVVADKVRQIEKLHYDCNAIEKEIEKKEDNLSSYMANTKRKEEDIKLEIKKLKDSFNEPENKDLDMDLNYLEDKLNSKEQYIKVLKSKRDNVARDNEGLKNEYKDLEMINMQLLDKLNRNLYERKYIVRTQSDNKMHCKRTSMGIEHGMKSSTSGVETVESTKTGVHKFIKPKFLPITRPHHTNSLYY